MSASPSPAIPEQLLEPTGGRLSVESTFRCEALHIVVRVRVCLLRQAVSSRQRTGDTWRGQCPDFPSCTERCPLGAKLRSRVGEVAWRGCGPSGRMVERRGPAERARQAAARERLERAGLLDPVPSFDEPPPEPDPDEG